MKGFLFGLISGGIVAAFGLIGAVAYAPVVEPSDIGVVEAEPPVEEAVDVEAPVEDAPEEAASGEEMESAPARGLPEAPALDDAPEMALATDMPETPETPETVTVEPTGELSEDEAGSVGGEVDPPPVTETPNAPVAREDAQPPSAPDTPALEVPTPDDTPEPEITEERSVTPPRASALGLGAESVEMPSPPDSDTAPILKPAGSLIDESAEGENTPPAIERYSTPFEQTGDGPLLAIVLRDDPARRPGAEALSALPIPVTVAIDPMLEDAAEVAALYKAAGIEIALTADLPDTAQPSDVEVAFGVYLRNLPQTVAVMDRPDGALQESRPRAIQVVEILKETGHGLLTYEKGLNSGLQIAAQEDLAAATVFRAFDDGERNVSGMKRFLDQAAFQAGLAAPVIVEGVMRPETLQALSEWALGQRAGQVTIAPLSAALLDSTRP